MTSVAGLVRNEPWSSVPRLPAGRRLRSMRFRVGAAAGAELLELGAAAGTRCVVYAGTDPARCGVGSNRTQPMPPKYISGQACRSREL